MSTKLRDLLEQAATDVDTYRHPDISEAQGALNKLLTAAGLRDTGDDQITSISIGREVVRVTTSFSVRCCEQSDEFEFPTMLLDCDDPVAAAQAWGLENELRVAQRDLSTTRAALVRDEAALEKVLSRVRDLHNSRA